MSEKFVYQFEEGNAKMKPLLGGKGANLAEMMSIGLPVPYGFTITTEACARYQEEHAVWSGMRSEVMTAVRELEKQAGKGFGDESNPLLVSVRSGAAVSMPGMMDTILNLGLNDVTVETVARNTGNPRFAYDCYRRFVQMFGEVVMQVSFSAFDEVIEAIKEKNGYTLDTDIPAEKLKELALQYKQIIKQETGHDFPTNVEEQLFMAIEAVFASWDNPRARVYRRINKIPDEMGTAVNIQMMVFGNMGDDSGTGVAFTRNPSTGEKHTYGEYLMNAQGEDVVSGVRTPKSIDQLADDMPEVHKEFIDVCTLLENHYRDMQDIEFTIEKGKLFLLQTRTGKRTAAAAVRAAVEMVGEGILTQTEALMRVDPAQLNQVMHRRVDPDVEMVPLAKGLPASPGAAYGQVVFDANIAADRTKEGDKVILVRTETTPDDIHGIVAAQGVLTSRGGMTSHAAVVARGMGKPCVCGCEQLKVNLVAKEFSVGNVTVKENDYITIDGTTGYVMVGKVAMVDPTLGEDFKTLLGWADQVRKLKVFSNADNPTDAAKAREFMAEGIGLCRTEHMFMAKDRLPIVQEMILAETEEEREVALAKLLPMQKGDFVGLFEVMDGLPVNIRLLDPPLHEFLPNSEELMVEVRTLRLTNGDPQVIKEKEHLLRKVKALTEFNPMLGHRGVRLGIVHPGIYRMQVRAIGQAVVEAVKKGINVIPEIMIPLVVHFNELRIMREMAVEVMDEILKDANIDIKYAVGTMIEAPRACVTAEEIVEYADFFSFGTNDLTQTTLGFSRDDAEGKFLHYYVEHKILEDNPFAVLDRNGVGRMIQIAVDRARTVKPDLKLGVCGEHGGDPNSIEFIHMLGLNYVSCSPYRVPIARLAAARAAIIHG